MSSSFDGTSTELRMFSVDQAVKTLTAAGRGFSSRQLLETADAIFEYIRPASQGVASLRLIRGTIVDQKTGFSDLHARERQAYMATNLKDSQQVDFTVEADDAKGYPVVDANALSASIDDTSVATVSQSGNTLTVVAGQPGNAVLSVTDGSITVTEAINVTAGDVATFNLTAGTPTEQNA